MDNRNRKNTPLENAGVILMAILLVIAAYYGI
jgi:hypothetical protein